MIKISGNSFSESHTESEKANVVEEYIFAELVEIADQLESSLEREVQLKEDIQNLQSKQEITDQSYKQLEIQLAESEEKAHELRTQIDTVETLSKNTFN